MATVSKPVSMQTKHMSKEDRKAREQAESMLKSSANEVYKVPSKLDDRTKKIYLSLTDRLKPLDILTDLDIDLLCITADAINQIERATEDINKYGQVIYQFDDDGNIVKASKNPSIDVVKNYEAIFKSGCSQLCLSPAARAKLSIDLADMLKGNSETEETQEDKDLGWLMGGN